MNTKSKILIRSSFSFIILFFMGVWGVHAQDSLHVMLPNGWALTPAGKHIELGDLPLNMASSLDGRWLAVTNNGYGRQSIDLIDTKHETKVSSTTIPKSWYGLAFSRNGRTLYASAGNDNQIKIYYVERDGSLNLSDSIVMGKPWPERISPAGLVVHPRKQELYVVTR